MNHHTTRAGSAEQLGERLQQRHLTLLKGPPGSGLYQVVTFGFDFRPRHVFVGTLAEVAAWEKAGCR